MVVHAPGELDGLPRSVPVLIAGGGPSGLFMALDLASRGIRSLVIEARVSIDFTRPRAKTTNARTMSQLRRIGLADRLRELAPLSAEFSEDVIFCSSLVGHEVARFHNAFQVVAGRYELQPEGGQQVAQPVVEEVLREGFAESAFAELVTGLRVTEVSHAPGERPRARVSDASGDSIWIESDYLIGADGGSSLVRQSLGIRLEGSSAARSNFNVLFRSSGLADRVALDTAIQYWVMRPAASGMLGRMDLDTTWWAIIQGIDPADELDPVALVRELAGADIDVDVIATDPWTARMLLASSYGTGRVFLVGDAAHLNPPWGGHGFNTCIGDAANLAWKIAAQLHGWAGPQLVETYGPERRPVAARTIRDAAVNGQALAYDFANPLLDADSAAGDAAREATRQALQVKESEFSSLGLVLGYQYPDSTIVVQDGTQAPGEDPIEYRPTGHPGSLLPHLWLPDGRSLYDLLGPDFTLVVNAFDSRAAEFERVAQLIEQDLHIPLIVRLIDLGGIDATRAIDELWGGPALLVRPDQHVAWRGDSPADVPAALRVAAGFSDAAAMTLSTAMTPMSEEAARG